MTINERVSDLIHSEIADFFAGFGSPGEPDIQNGDAQRQLSSRIDAVLQQYRAAAEHPVAWRYRYTKPGVTDSYGEPWVGDWRYVADEENCNPMKNYERQPLYAAPQVTSVPDEMTYEQAREITSKMSFLVDRDSPASLFAAGYNACRMDVFLAAPAVQAAPQTAAARDVLAERQRQVTAEGWKPSHDDEHVNGELAGAASCYAFHAAYATWDLEDNETPYDSHPVPKTWPWESEWWKPVNQRHDLVRAGALILAEIERIDRANGAPAVQAESILRNFYSAYGEWIDSGAPDGNPFMRGAGLCANLFDYVTSLALEGLHAEFVAAGLGEKLPFNASEAEFKSESGRGECHTNPARVAWVRARIAQPAVQAEQLSGNTEQVSQPYTLPDGCCIMPMKLTAENGAKGALSGEFSETKFINCPECLGDDECETCDGSGRIEITVPVSWTTIKEIWAKGVEHFAAAPQQEAQEVKK